MYATLLAVMATVTATGDLEWSSHYAQAKSAAATAQKPLLVVLENPSEPKRRFDEEKLASKEEHQKLLKNFELCRVDVTTPYGKRVAEALGATELPYTAITDKTAKYITYRGAGQVSAENWTKTLNERKNGERILAPVQSSTSQNWAEPMTFEWPTAPAQPSCPSCVRNSYYR